MIMFKAVTVRFLRVKDAKSGGRKKSAEPLMGIFRGLFVNQTGWRSAEKNEFSQSLLA